MITFHSYFPKDIILGRHQIYYKRYLKDSLIFDTVLHYSFYIDRFDRELLNNINIYLGGQKRLVNL